MIKCIPLPPLRILLSDCWHNVILFANLLSISLMAYSTSCWGSSQLFLWVHCGHLPLSFLLCVIRILFISWASLYSFSCVLVFFSVPFQLLNLYVFSKQEYIKDLYSKLWKGRYLAFSHYYFNILNLGITDCFQESFNIKQWATP